MAEFKIERIQQGKIQIFRTQGYLDDSGGKTLKELCTKAIDEGNSLFVFNLAGTPVINSTGLSMLLDLMVRIIDYNDGKVGVTGLSKLTRTALQMTGVLTLAKEFASEADAQSALGA
ncbi:MAG: STAS domain-containing protein [Candidatus Ozemobacteraceae bacterium]